VPGSGVAGVQQLTFLVLGILGEVAVTPIPPSTARRIRNNLLDVLKCGADASG
jgi:hypothetical protein